MRHALNIIVFYTGWIACAYGASAGHPWFGPTFVVVGVGAQMLWLTNPGRRLLFITAVGAVGMALDAVHLRCRIVGFREPAWFGVLGPAWMTALWMNFGATLHESLRWFRTRLVRAALFGAVGGPLSYLAGARLGAMSIGEPQAWSLGWLAVTWGIVTPLALELSGRPPFAIDADGGSAELLSVK